MSASAAYMNPTQIKLMAAVFSFVSHVGFLSLN